MVRNPPALSPLKATCSTQRALDIIADKWTPLVVHLLSQGTFRYSDLHRAIEGISQKMLTQTLRNLEANGLATRTVYPEVPPRTEYALTPLGRTLTVPLHAICEWAGTYMPELDKARAAREAARNPPGADR